MSKIRKNKLRVIKRVLSLILLSVMLVCGMPINTFALESKNSESAVVVSMGDSYSSGEGIPPFYGQELTDYEKVKNYDWLAHRSEKAWPGMLSLPSLKGTMSENPTNWFFVAASGATTQNIVGEFEKKYYKKQNSRTIPVLQGKEPLPPQIDIFNELKKEGEQADYVTLTIGGNDVDFTGTVIAAVCSSTYLTPAYLADKINNTWKNFYEGGIREDICSTYQAICDAAGEQAQVLVAGYPKLLSPGGSAVLFSEEAAQCLNRAVSQFNDAIEAIVYDYRLIHGYNIWFLSVEEAFQGHGAYSEDPYLNGVKIGAQSEDINDSEMVSSYSMHPNEKGAVAYAECVQAKIDELERELSETTNSKFNTNLELTVYDEDYALYDDYTVDISGTYNAGWFGWFEEEYTAHYVVESSNPLSIILHDRGNYTITITDNGGEGKSYSKDIEVSEKYVNKRVAFSTDFGTSSEKDIGGQFDSGSIPESSVEFNGHYYHVYNFDAITSWEDAKKICESQGGYLATITSKEENDFLFSYMNQEGYTSAYFGFSDTVTEGIWKWCNEENALYTNWHDNEPNGENANEDYAMFYYQYTDGTWNDGDFGNEILNGGTAFICEWGGYEVASQVDKLFEEVSNERNIALVLDVSGSMSGTPLDETKMASNNFINTILEEDASIGLIAYDDQAEYISSFSNSKTLLQSAVTGLSSGGSTNIEDGLSKAANMLNSTTAKKKIIVLMSDGEPNIGREGEELIAYANEIKEQGILIYTLGFFESLGQKSSAQQLMEGIASDGCHYEVASADDLVFFFEDMADQINGQKYIYVRIACPVDVSVTYNGQTLSSSENELNLRTEFGTLTFEESEEETSENEDDRIKVLRLKEGVDYDIQINGTGHGFMNYTIGFMDEEGDYDDFRTFENIKITRRTKIDTVAAVSSESILNIDENGDGKYDLKLKAEANGYGEEVKIPEWIFIVIGLAVTMIIIDIFILIFLKKRKNKRRKADN